MQKDENIQTDILFQEKSFVVFVIIHIIENLTIAKKKKKIGFGVVQKMSKMVYQKKIQIKE